MAEPISVLVCGARGKMGRMVVDAVGADAGLRLAGEVDLGDDLVRALEALKPAAVVDFTNPSVAFANGLASIKAGAAPIIGTTGIPTAEVDELAGRAATAGLGGAVIPNFALGAVLMIRLAEIASPFFDAVEVIEGHSQAKLDAPSGTALHTAQRLAAARSSGFAYSRPEKVTLESARGGVHEGVAVHSLRLPGLVADQEIVFGALGQTLSISHRTTSRDSFMPGVLATVKAAVGQKRFYRSLDEVLGLPPLGGGS